MRTRAEVAESAAARLESAAELPAALVGFDGFIDEITEVVDRRADMTPGGYSRLGTIGALAARIAAAAGRSTNLELVVRERRFGGNGPLMAAALGCLGAPVTFIGAVGDESGPTRLHPLFAELARLCREVIPLEPPSLTHALEFEDGKVMFNRTAAVQAVTWDRLIEAVGLDRLRCMVASSRLLAIVNWSLMVGVEGIWRGLTEHVLGSLPDPPRVMIDLSDPAKRTDEDVRNALSLLAQMNRSAPVTLGLNLSEAERLARAVHLSPADSLSTGNGVQRLAAALQERLGLNTIVIHPREGAAAASLVEGRVVSAWFDGPFTRAPVLSTGAGDHFNAGFALAQVMRMPLDECLALGCAVSGAYVRDGRAPTRERAVVFLRNLPQPNREPG